MTDADGLTPENPEDEGLVPPELTEEEVEGARLLANEARERLQADGFTDVEINRWTRLYYTESEGGRDEGDVDGLLAFIAEQQATGSSS
jgi:hypothetical protein